MMHRSLLLLACLPAFAAASEPIAIQTPGPGVLLTRMPVDLALDFDAAADAGTLAVLLNGTDVTAAFSISPPAGGRRIATATDVWADAVLAGANLVSASIDLAGSPESAQRAFHTSGDPYADAVVSTSLGTGGGFNSAGLPDVVLGPPQGSGMFQGSLDVASLGLDGAIVLRFSDNRIVDGPGVDFTVFENSFLEIGAGGITEPPFAEAGRVSVSQDGVTWFAFSCDLVVSEGPYWPGCAGVYPVIADGTSNTDHASIPTDVPIEDHVGVHWTSVTVPPGGGGDSFDLADVGLAWARFVRIEAADFSNGPTGPDNAGFDLDAVAAVNSEPAGAALPLLAPTLRGLLVLLLAATAALASTRPGSAQTRRDVAAPPPRDALPQQPSLDERLEEIRLRVQQQVVYPPIARARGVDGTVRVGFEIDGRGRATRIAVTESSGNGALDGAAVRAVESAQRLPYLYGRVAIPVRFALRED